MLSTTGIYAGWHDRKAEGWAWYEEKLTETPNQLNEDLVPNPSPADTIQAVREDLQEKLSRALLDPTPENVLAYMQEQQKWTDKSAEFAGLWTQLLLSNPHLDYTVTGRPVSQYGLQQFKQHAQQEKETLITSLTQDYGLFFFYEGQQPSSQVFGDIVKFMSSKYGFEIIAISADDTKLQGFKEVRSDNGISKTLGVDLYPALYLINPKEDVAVPISFGLVSLDQIESNIVKQFKDRIDHD